MADFLSGKLDDTYRLTDNPLSCTWTNTRKASNRLGLFWGFTEDVTPAIKFHDVVISPQHRTRLARMIREQLKSIRTEEFLERPMHGKVMQCVAQDPASSHFLLSGNSTTFADWRFIHRARLNALALNGCKPWRTGPASDKLCRRCNNGWDETVPHVLHHCMRYSASYTHRHNEIVTRVKKAAERSWTVFSMNTFVGATRCRPDLIVTKGTSAVIIDVSIIAENQMDVFANARREKVLKYQPVVEHLRRKFSNVRVEAILLGGLGTWDPENDVAMRGLCARKYLKKMKEYAVSDIIRWSRRIYIHHLTDEQQWCQTDIAHLDAGPLNEPARRQDQPLVDDPGNPPAPQPARRNFVTWAPVPSALRTDSSSPAVEVNPSTSSAGSCVVHQTDFRGDSSSHLERNAKAMSAAVFHNASASSSADSPPPPTPFHPPSDPMMHHQVPISIPPRFYPVSQPFHPNSNPSVPNCDFPPISDNVLTVDPSSGRLVRVSTEV